MCRWCLWVFVYLYQNKFGRIIFLLYDIETSYALLKRGLAGIGKWRREELVFGAGFDGYEYMYTLVDSGAAVLWWEGTPWWWCGHRWRCKVALIEQLWRRLGLGIATSMSNGTPSESTVSTWYYPPHRGFLWWCQISIINYWALKPQFWGGAQIDDEVSRRGWWMGEMKWNEKLGRRRFQRSKQYAWDQSITRVI